jgi:hypothetical protein
MAKLVDLRWMPLHCVEILTKRVLLATSVIRQNACSNNSTYNRRKNATQQQANTDRFLSS